MQTTLRERRRLTSIKDGCHAQGQCGACTAIVGGHARVTCTLPTEKAEGTAITTFEGLSAEERDLAARAFATAGGRGGALRG